MSANAVFFGKTRRRSGLFTSVWVFVFPHLRLVPGALTVSDSQAEAVLLPATSGDPQKQLQDLEKASRKEGPSTLPIRLGSSSFREAQTSSQRQLESRQQKEQQQQGHQIEDSAFTEVANEKGRQMHAIREVTPEVTLEVVGSNNGDDKVRNASLLSSRASTALLERRESRVEGPDKPELKDPGDPDDSYNTALRKLMFSTKERTLATYIGCAVACGVLLFEFIHLSFSGVDFEARCSPLDNVGVERERPSRGPMAGAADLWWGFFVMFKVFSSTAIALVLGTILLMQFGQLMLVDWSENFWQHMQVWGAQGGMGQEGRLFALLTQFLWIAFIIVMAGVYQSYIVSMFCIKARAQICQRFVNLWLDAYAYYRMELGTYTGVGGSDNPDQRIQEDVAAFTRISVDLVIGLISNSIQMVLFSKKVYAASPDQLPFIHVTCPGWLLPASFLYALAAMLVMFFLGRKLEIYTQALQRSEADYRWELVNVRSHAEQVALASSEPFHNQRTERQFDNVRRMTWETMFVEKKMSFGMHVFGQVKEIFPFIFLGPAFLEGSITFGVLMAASRTMGLLESSVLFFPRAFNEFCRWRANADRLTRVKESMIRYQGVHIGADIKKQQMVTDDGDVPLPTISTNDLTVWLPPKAPSNFSPQLSEDKIIENPASKDYIYHKLNMNLTAGERVLLVGPSGSGKSTLIRALSGSWPFCSGSVSVPGGTNGIFFSTTDVYAPPGELRDVVTYPLPPAEITDKRISEALNVVGLEHLAENEDGLSTVKSWDIALSAGQKNRMALARLVLHKPKAVALDEPVSHIDIANRAKVLKACLEQLPRDAVVLCISHDLSDDIVALFDSEYSIDVKNQTLKKTR
eukprot:TRINITY_DN13081_c0_g1_i1.p1 TRINITY_DN13081_c0_g1~~TRINITY_DN13081_c0_g1_i1.p1  ORF type:complete len:861 (-),score=164.25 TRINITY_DN13081_c0_g1_i1:54-2636(-)